MTHIVEIDQLSASAPPLVVDEAIPEFLKSYQNGSPHTFRSFKADLARFAHDRRQVVLPLDDN